MNSDSRRPGVTGRLREIEDAIEVLSNRVDEISNELDVAVDDKDDESLSDICPLWARVQADGETLGYVPLNEFEIVEVDVNDAELPFRIGQPDNWVGEGDRPSMSWWASSLTVVEASEVAL